MLYRGTAYSLLNCKTVDDQRRRITGVASTPTVDRVGDIVNPLGAKFRTPMPLLLYHDSQKPVGNVDFARPTKTGIPFEASLPLVNEPGIVQERVNEALHSLKYKLLACVSIGFQALKGGVELLKDGGLMFNEWEWLELTLCSVPANPEAVIHGFKTFGMSKVHGLIGTHPASPDEAARAAFIEAIKSIDMAIRRAAPGARPVVRLKPLPADTGNTAPGASGLELPRRKGVVYLK